MNIGIFEKILASRLSLYKKWYGLNHSSKNLIKNSVYAITEFSRRELKSHKIIACPGCYPTSIQLPLIPIFKNKMVKTDNIIIYFKSIFGYILKRAN